MKPATESQKKKKITKNHTHSHTFALWHKSNAKHTTIWTCVMTSWCCGGGRRTQRFTHIERKQKKMCERKRDRLLGSGVFFLRIYSRAVHRNRTLKVFIWSDCNNKTKSILHTENEKRESAVSCTAAMLMAAINFIIFTAHTHTHTHERRA